MCATCVGGLAKARRENPGVGVIALDMVIGTELGSSRRASALNY